jgi:hypothetical protein
MHNAGIISLVPTALLCLPSFAGAAALLGNALLRRHVEEWGAVSSVTVASAVYLGWPLIVMAAVVGALAGMSHRVSQRVKYAHTPSSVWQRWPRSP